MLEKRGWRWSEWREWSDLDNPARWKYEYEEHGKVQVGDWVEDYFNELREVLSGVG